MLWGDAAKTAASIAQFSPRDAEAFVEYEAFLDKVREVVQPLLDGPPPTLSRGGIRNRQRTLSQLTELASVGFRHRRAMLPMYLSAALSCAAR